MTKLDDRRLRVGVIGVGHLGSIHARLWKTIADAEFVGLFDTDMTRASGIAAEHGVQAFGSLIDLLDAVDAVSIVAPTSAHAEIATVALGRGVHCFVEKPITSRYHEAALLIALAAERGLTLQVGHVERFNPAFLALRDQVLEPMFIESHRLAQFTPRATDVAVVLDLMIHDIDLILHLVKSDLKDVKANGVAVVSDSIDIANARLEFTNGCVANITASRISQRPMRKMRLFQRDAYISIDFAKPALEIFRITDDPDVGTSSTIALGQIDQGSRRRTITYDQPPVPPVNAIGMELEDFVRAVASGIAPAVTAEAGAEALRVAELVMKEIENLKSKIQH